MLATEQHMNRRRILCVTVLLMQLITWSSATSRPFAPHDEGQRPMFFPHTLSSKQDSKRMVNEEAYSGLSTIGSRPPNCDHKCGGCVPCEAIQVPTTNDKVKVQYANYEPEGWKCKCGSSFYTP